ncbi:predicted protein [Chaetomium globosum CBS 148.51]|uniref:Secreted protein n=1 Tax=Chaetomium globosum (strain ATCC 6205 / CBS 148.51 / DSM 1962 / NBRC 6347 / NRRL 1970) TaxID=306901 RepID=Q2H5E2_CHAGB|nr:uncharacterized protein CHGG_06123 [Chaetomium globosum CBS 148.51]EAQ89504.1 predicted protein [Chaetomium globosum CBS 148.51]
MTVALMRLLTVLTAAAVVRGHAVMEVPTPRRAGSAYTERCGNTYAEFMETGEHASYRHKLLLDVSKQDPTFGRR